jgi:hypothetical protein
LTTTRSASDPAITDEARPGDNKLLGDEGAATSTSSKAGVPGRKSLETGWLMSLLAAIGIFL